MDPVPFSREPHFSSAASALLLFAILSAVVHAEIGDHWAPKEVNTPVYEGPDRAFRVIAYVGPDDVIRQQSNKKIRGFLKMLVPRENYATGYVLEEQIEFLGGMDSEETVGTAQRDKPKQDEGLMEGAEASAGFGWTAWIVIFVLAVAAASVSWVLVRRRSPPSGPVAGIAGDFVGSLKDRFAQARSFLYRNRPSGPHGIRGNRSAPDTDHSFIDDLLPPDFDAQIENSGDLDDRDMSAEDQMPDIEKVAQVYDLVLRQFESGRRVPDLWARAITLAAGKEEAAKCKYVELLVARISEQRLSRQDSGSTDPPP